MPQSKKGPRRQAPRAASGSTAAPAVDEELTRLAVEALPESERRRWERQQRAAAAERAARARNGEDESDAQRDAEDLAEEITTSARRGDQLAEPTPVWYRVIMFGLIIVGLLWLILWYLLDFSYPLPGIGYWNVAVGVGLMLIGLIMTTRWR